MTEQNKLTAQPVSSVEWIDRDQLFANDYNPNNVFRPEMRLLKLSLLEDGWTLPLVVKDNGSGPPYEIIDGFHRWTLSGEPELMELTGGMVPIVKIPIADRARQMMSTIRYNRARGVHHLVKMADIVGFMHHHGVPMEATLLELGMEKEEYTRLLERGNMRNYGKDQFGKGLEPHLREDMEIK